MTKHPFQQKMPLGTDLRIRFRLLRVWLQQHRAIASAALLVPALAAWIFLVTLQNEPVTLIDTVALANEVRAAQTVELARASSSIYHVVREIREGSDKPAFVASVLGVTASATPRVDIVETYQHNETALTQIVSNGTQRQFEVFLSREHDGSGLALHHYGPVTTEVPIARAAYDDAHDLASLYTTYTTLEQPGIPVLADAAEIIRVDSARNSATFRTQVNDTLYIDSIVDLDTKLVIEDVIFVQAGNGKWYEMTRVAYLERSVIAAEEFDTIFNPGQYDFEVIAIRNTTNS